MERECTFAPVIDARSAGMMSHRSIVLKVWVLSPAYGKAAGRMRCMQFSSEKDEHPPQVGYVSLR